MFLIRKTSVFIGMAGLLITLMLVGGVQVSGLAASLDSVEVLPYGLHADRAGFSLSESSIPAAPEAPNACHAVSGYGDTLEYDDFCVIT